MKIIFVTDLHGSEWKHNRLFEVAVGFKADVVINAGDMLPMHGDLFMQGEFITSFLDGYFEGYDASGIYYLSYLGNDDLMVFDRVFEETCSKYRFVVPLAQRKFDLNGYEFIGMNWVVDYPFRLKDRCRMDMSDYLFQEQLGTGLLSTRQGFREVEDWPDYARTLPTIEDELCKVIRPVKMAKAVYVIHMPPAGLGLDKCYSGAEVGSKAMYDFIVKNQPLMTLHGHIHESPSMTGKWYAELGKTICIQPGQLDNLTYVVIDLETMEFEKYDEAFGKGERRG